MMERPPISANSFALILDGLRALWVARRLHVVLSVAVSLPLTLFGLLGLFDPLYLALGGTQQPPGLGLALALFFAWVVAWNAPGLVLWYRRFLLGPDQFLRIGLKDLAGRAFWFAVYSVAMGGLGLVVGLLALTLVGAVVSIVSSGGTRGMPSGPLIIVLFGVFLYLAARFSLTFAAIALGRRLPFADSWRRTAPCALAIFGALVLAVFLALMASSLVTAVLALVAGSSGTPAAPPPGIFFIIDLIASPFAYMSAALSAAISARVYAELVGTPVDARGIRV